MVGSGERWVSDFVSVNAEESGAFSGQAEVVPQGKSSC